MVQRYAVALVAFAVAAAWTGLPLANAFECLLAFTLTSLVVGIVQGRGAVAERSRGRRARPAAKRERTRGYEHSTWVPRPHSRLYDGDTDDWPQPAERW